MWYRRSLLDLIDPNWESKSVLAIAFPAPPVPAKGFIYPVQNWNSNVLDKLITISSKDAYPKMTSKGPAVMREFKLTELLQADYTYNKDLFTPQTMYCATISFVIRGTDEHVAKDAWIDKMSRITTSCHPGSHMCVPRAPYLTAFLQLQHAGGRGHPEPGFKFADELDGAYYYSGVDFSANEEVDKLFQYLTLQDAFNTPHDQPAKWMDEESHAYLSNRLLYKIAGTVDSNSNVFSSVNGDLSRAISIIQQRNNLLGL